MLTIVVGAQFGSEGKGNIVGHIAGGFQVHVRVGAANAGHTVYTGSEKHVVQQLPCAAYANPHAKLVLGAGAMITPHILEAEIRDNVTWRQRHDCPPLQLYIDQAAHVIMPRHIEREQQSGLAERIGSTSTIAREGIGAAQAARVMRTDYRTAGEENLTERWARYDAWILFENTVKMLHDAKTMGTSILLEGTQGTGLDNVLGFYPYVTSRHVTASGILADCGFGPSDADSVLAVARTFPIRVAGPSGPFWPDSVETEWGNLGIDSETERTTVTKKVRRVATFSYEQIQHAARVNSATEIALNFADYLAPEIRGKTGSIDALKFRKFDRIGPMVDKIEDLTGTPVVYVGTGPNTTLDRLSPYSLGVE